MTKIVSQRLCYHYQSPNHGSQYTRRHQPISVVGLCVKRTRDAKACLALEDELVLQTMFEYCCKYSHPEVWKCVAGGSWSKVDAKHMPRPLQFRLANMPPVENKNPRRLGTHTRSNEKIQHKPGILRGLFLHFSFSDDGGACSGERWAASGLGPTACHAGCRRRRLCARTALWHAAAEQLCRNRSQTAPCHAPE